MVGAVAEELGGNGPTSRGTDKVGMTPAISLVTGLLGVYLRAASKASRALLRGWHLIPLSVAAFLLFLFVSLIVSPLGIVGQFIIGIMIIVSISYYYQWLHGVVRLERCTRQGILEFDRGYFSAALNASFLLFPANLIATEMARNPDTAPISAMISLAMVVLLNPLPEMIHVRRFDGFETLVGSVRFVQQHWIEWFIPFLVLLTPFLMLGSVNTLIAVSAASPLLPVTPVIFAGQLLLPGESIIGSVLGVILGNWFMIFRAFLFEELDSGSARKRAFRASLRP